MLQFLEHSVILRPFNFLRIKHDYSIRYNLIYPIIITAAFIELLLGLSSTAAIFGNNGLISKLLQLLSILAPFYIAALAAISTFNGSGMQMDSPMTGKIPPYIYLYIRGSWEKKLISTRYFLSMLFSYCAINSIGLFVIGLIATFLADDIRTQINFINLSLIKYSFVALYTFFFSHLLLTTIIGIYYLGDKLHRPT